MFYASSCPDPYLSFIFSPNVRLLFRFFFSLLQILAILAQKDVVHPIYTENRS